MRGRAVPWVALGVVAGVAFATEARAGNTDEVLLGNEAALLGGAVTAIVSQGSALWYNPAGLRYIEQNSVDLSLSGYSLRLYRIPDALVSTSGAAANANATEAIIVPAAAAYVRTTKSGLRLGFGVFTTASASYDQRPGLSFPDQSMPNLDWEWLIELDNQVSVYQLIGGIAWAVNDKVYLGATLDGSYVNVTQSAQVGGALIQNPETSQAILTATASSRFAITGLTARLGFGVMWKPSRAIHLGASFQTASYLFFQNTSIQLIQSGGAVLPDGSFSTLNLDASNVSDSSLGFDPFDPWRVRAGFAYDFGRALLSLDTDLQVSQGPTKATVNGRVGALIQLSGDLFFGVGAFTDLDPYGGPPSGLGDVDFEINFYGLTTGIELNQFRKFATGEDSDGISFQTAVAFRYAFGTGGFEGIQVVDDVSMIDLENPTLIETTSTRVRVHEISIYVGAGLRF